MFIKKMLTKLLLSQQKKEKKDTLTNTSPPVNFERLDEQQIRMLFAKSADIMIQKYHFDVDGHYGEPLLLYCNGMADLKQLNQYVLPQLENMIRNGSIHSEQVTGKTLPLEPIDLKAGVGALVSSVYAGNLIVIFETVQLLYALDIADPPHRQPEESNTETTIKGPKDGFTEELVTNIALVRKRLRTQSLCYEQFIVGRRSKTKVGLLYMEDITKHEVVEEARSRLNGINIDAIFSSAQLEELLSDSSNSLFPLLDYTGRPDYIADCLMHGRLAIIVDGAPTAVIAPANFTLLLKSPEDAYFPFYYVTLERFLRLLGLIIALFLPGFWVSLSSFHMDQLPFPLMATVTLSRIGLPLPAPLEVFLMLGLFELFREAGARLPKAVGQTVAVVGGLIIGDASIKAGLASTTMLVVSATTAVATFTLVNQSLSGSVTIIRLYVLLCSSFLGMYGFFLAVFSVVLYLSQLKSFGMPYLAPLSPLRISDVLASLFKKPIRGNNARPEILQTKDSTRQGGEGS
ncbi:spore germination protein [Paenibacillus eucommiae]|uniref:Spore germination protein n=1 Tax=Paenibacillus eucommiae TaxID=1355755 RepID=A0ABS4IQZ9_9BACL|nr:spore germination protein [Paenibacillus eucommiae]MBP1989960.1 hypothetical protein [Paenibacillus eucommiae]